MDYTEFEDKLNATDFFSPVQSDIRDIIFEKAKRALFDVLSLFKAMKGRYINLFKIDEISRSINDTGFTLMSEIVARLDDEFHPELRMNGDD